MALIYFSKFNINSKIYEVYNNPELEKEILDDVFEKIDTVQEFIGEYKSNDGTDTKMEFRYKFCDIEKDHYSPKLKVQTV